MKKLALLLLLCLALCAVSASAEEGMGGYMMLKEKAQLFTDESMTASAYSLPRFSIVYVSVLPGDELMMSAKVADREGYITKSSLTDPMDFIEDTTADGEPREFPKAATKKGCRCYIYPKTSSPSSLLNANYECEVLGRKGKWALIRSTQSNLFGYVQIKNLKRRIR